MIGELARFEWRYHTRQISFAAAAVLFLLFGVALTATGFGPANVHVNSPYSIVQSTGVLSLFAVFILAVFSANAIVRDRDFRMEEIVFSTAIEKRPFLGARFGGSFLAAMTAFSASLLGMMSATLLPSIERTRLGAFHPAHYVWALLVIALPNLLFAAVVLFAIATLTRSLLATSVGAVLMYVLYLAAAAMTNSPLMAGAVPSASDGFPLGALLDPFGLSAFFQQTRYWTPAERNANLPSLTGVFLANRVLWIAVAGVLFAVVYRVFAFRLIAGAKKRGARRRDDEPRDATTPIVPYERVAARVPHAYWSAVRIELLSFVRSLPFLALTLLWAGLALSTMASDVGSGEYGASLIPTTGIVLSTIQAPLQLIALIVLIYFSAELVWRERMLRFDGILHATPSSSATFVLSKWTVLAALTAILIATGSVVAVLFQLANGAPRIDVLAIAEFAWFGGAPLVLFAAAMLLIHTLVPNKYLGILIAVVLAALLKNANVNLLWRYSATPPVAWSDMNRFGPFAAECNRYIVHWALVAALFVLLAVVMWRGTRRLSHATRIAAALLGLAIVASAMQLYDGSDPLQWRADYEKTYAKFATLPRPHIVAVRADVSLYPNAGRYDVRGEQQLRNDTPQAIGRVLVSLPNDVHAASVTMPGATLVTSDTRFGQYWFTLVPPLAPGASTELRFAFSSSEPQTAVVANGSFVSGSRAFPSIGYRPSYELSDPVERRKHDLAPRAEDADESDENGDDGWLAVDVTLSTSADQRAVTSGTVVREWVANGRRFMHYRTARAVPNALAFASATYAVARAQEGGVGIAVYYDPSHGANVARMLRAARESLRTFTAAFGPYPHAQLKLVEVPSPGNNFGGLARPDTIFIGENRGFLIDARDARHLDLVTRRVAHEVAHQWWGLDVTPVAGPGASMIAESLTKYSELVILRQLYGGEIERESLTYELDLYLAGRAAARDAEVPLVRTGNDAYLYYRKGALVLHAVEQLLGAPALHAALRAFRAQEAGPAHHPTTARLLAQLDAVATPEQQRLIHRWCSEIVLYDLKLDAANARRRADGRFDVTLRVIAHPLPEPEDLDLALYAAGDETPFAMTKQRLHDGVNDIALVADRLPTSAAVDPYLCRIDRNRFDNTHVVDVR
jgi:ABC-2 type transport system permease protein